MFTVKIRDHIMIAHSLPHPFFGPAQHMHGATYVVDAEFKSEKLDAHNVVIDIGLASDILKKALAPLAYKNLDEVEFFKNKLTTTEFLAQHIHSAISEKVKATFNGSLKITLGESHIAWASYEAPIS